MYKIGYQCATPNDRGIEVIGNFVIKTFNQYTYYLINNATFDLRNRHAQNFSTQSKKAALYVNLPQAQEAIIKLTSRMTPKLNESITPFYFCVWTNKTYTFTEGAWVEQFKPTLEDCDDDFPF